MFLHLKRFLIVFVLFALLAGCGVSEPAAPTDAPADAPTDTAVPSPIPSPSPTAAPEAGGSQLTVPRGQVPLIDGTIMEGEWDAAAEISLPDGSRLFFLHAEGSLFLGIQANTDDMIVGNVFLDLGTG